jgi:hypothetical protein
VSASLVEKISGCIVDTSSSPRTGGALDFLRSYDDGCVADGMVAGEKVAQSDDKTADITY